MRLTAEFECGNGKNVLQLAPGHFRIEEVGEESPYCKYFCARLQAGEDGGRVRVDVYADPLLGEVGRTGMMGHSMTDSRGWFYSCMEPERADKLRRRWAMEQELRERDALENLLAKYGSPHKDKR